MATRTSIEAIDAAFAAVLATLDGADALDRSHVWQHAANLLARCAAIEAREEAAQEDVGMDVDDCLTLGCEGIGEDIHHRAQRYL